MDDTKLTLLGVQTTLFGIPVVTFFDGTNSVPLFGLLLGVLGTAIVGASLVEP